MCDRKSKSSCNAAYTDMPPQSQDLPNGLLRALQHIDPNTRRRAASALAGLGPVGLPYLVQLLEDRDPEVRRRAVASVGRVGPVAHPVIHRVAHLLGDRSVDVRRSATSALGEIGIAAAPSLYQACENDDSEVRHRANAALNRISQAANRSAVGPSDVRIDDFDHLLPQHSIFETRYAA